MPRQTTKKKLAAGDPVVLETRDILGIEILSEGTWQGTGCPVGGCVFTEADLDNLVATYDATKEVLSPPVKLGHDDNQKLLQDDGYPAAGWLTNIRREGTKLMADIMKVPKAVADLMDVGAYRTRSVELDSNFTVGGKVYDIALTALALLGAELPAVEGLSDITKLYSSRKLALKDTTKAVIFAVPTVQKHKFTLPTGMSYDDLRSELCMAFCEASPACDPDCVWVSDVYETNAIFCLDGRYWQQDYSITTGTDPEVALMGTPTEVERVTNWAPVSSAGMGMRYVDQAERLLADVTAFVERTEELASMRATAGRELSEAHQKRLKSLHDKLSDTVVGLALITRPKSMPNVKSKMRQALIQAEVSLLSMQEER